MTEHHVEVVRVTGIEKHPNADTLSIGKARGYPVIFRTGDYQEGDLAAYVPIDSVVSPNDPRFSFLGEHRRIKAKRLRGVFSMGLLTPADPAWVEGQDVAAELRIEKYTPPEEMDAHGLNETDPGIMPVYDVEGLRRWPDVLRDGEEVVITEKLHGENGRFVHDGVRLWVGSRTKIKTDSPSSKWWQAARRYELAEKLATIPGVALYGEVHGYTGGFPYGVEVGTAALRFFDAVDTKTRAWLDADEFFALCARLNLPTVPLLHRGPWSSSKPILALAEGPSTLANHVREGFVVRPAVERWHDGLGRVILKLHGEGFLLRGKA